MNDPHKDLRSLGDRLFDKRDLPIATGTSKADGTPSIAANMIRAKSFYFATDTGVMWYSDGTVWVAASNAFGPKVYAATVIPTSETTTSATLADLATVGPSIASLVDGTYIVLWGADASTSNTASNAGMAITLGPAFTSTIGSGAIAEGVNTYSVMKAAVVTLSGGAANALRARYQSTDGVSTATLANRWLTAIRVST